MKRRSLVLIIAAIIGLVALGGGLVNVVKQHETATSRRAQTPRQALVASTSKKTKTSQAEIAGQSIKAPQLGKSAAAWQNGAGTVSDGHDTNQVNQPTRQLTKTAKSIIIYYSRSGSTELLASKIAQQTKADILEIVVKTPYAANYSATLARANSERAAQDYPTLDLVIPDLAQYRTVYLGYPIWAMTLSHPMTAFLEKAGGQLDQKKIAPFMTQGGYGEGDSVQQIRQILTRVGGQNNRFTRALVVDGNKVDQADQQVARWIQQVDQTN
ncbi:flavodoxin family protein [Lapidilactobacillus luobeiensis]|uniref:flavodoxin family protein n=1 Tax=Lapidilactobacillus luobeiensis TaxID=2950371 RepID=UPI0021C44C65|nr:flavodoxin [Lapidilactobacillus luobeiensis]